MPIPSDVPRSEILPDDSTEASASYHLSVSNQERAAIGMPPQPRIVRKLAPIVVMPLRANVLPADDRSLLALYIARLVKRFGLSAVKLAVEHFESAEAPNGRAL